MKKFKYDVIELITCIRDRPCLWDKSIDNYKDRLERGAAWEEIFGILDSKYDEMTGEERRLMGEQVIYKWTNIRDTFMKSLKTKLGKPKRRYMLYEELKFLKKILPEEESHEEEEPTYMKQEVEETTEIESPLLVRKRPKRQDDNEDYVPKSNFNLRKRSKVRESEVSTPKPNELSNDVDFVGVDESDPRIMNEDEAFFASLLPTVVRYDEDDKLDFRIGVLAVMKKIKDSKKWVIEEG